MLDKKLRELIEITAKGLVLNPYVVEKDYYVTEILDVLSKIKNEYFDLVFCGGTCLAKAHRIVKRMSEDVDFKFQRKAACDGFSKTKYLKVLKEFRNQIVASLEKTAFTFGEVAVRNEGQYLRIILDYPTMFRPNLALRSHILLEFTASTIRLPAQELPVSTLIQDTLGDVAGLKSCMLGCISIEETAVEKWVGLTRRIAAIDRGYYTEDIALVRHIYDLSAIYNSEKIEDNFFNMTKQIISNDAQQFKNQHPEYYAEPTQEIKKSIFLLKNDPVWEKRYQDFINNMVYDKSLVQNYQDAIQLLEKVSEKVIGNI